MPRLKASAPNETEFSTNQIHTPFWLRFVRSGVDPILPPFPTNARAAAVANGVYNKWMKYLISTGKNDNDDISDLNE